MPIYDSNADTRRDINVTRIQIVEEPIAERKRQSKDFTSQHRRNQISLDTEEDQNLSWGVSARETFES